MVISIKEPLEYPQRFEHIKMVLSFTLLYPLIAWCCLWETQNENIELSIMLTKRFKVLRNYH